MSVCAYDCPWFSWHQHENICSGPKQETVAVLRCSCVVLLLNDVQTFTEGHILYPRKMMFWRRVLSALHCRIGIKTILFISKMTSDVKACPFRRPSRAPHAVTWALHVYKHAPVTLPNYLRSVTTIEAGGVGDDVALIVLCSWSHWSPHSVFTMHEVFLWGKIRFGGFLWLQQRSLSLRAELVLDYRFTRSLTDRPSPRPIAPFIPAPETAVGLWLVIRAG